MIIATVLSKNNVPIRLTNERWQHIIINHPEIEKSDFSKFIKIIKNPEFILKGNKGEFLAIKKLYGKRLWIVVPYKEIN